MHITTAIKYLTNRVLRRANLQVETLTAQKQELKRLALHEEKGYFERIAFPVLDGIRNAEYSSLLQSLPMFAERFRSFRASSENDVGYCFDNQYFSSPDAEILYTIIRAFCPKKFLEIGCGNSTRVAKQAIKDSGIATHLVSVDPEPRVDIIGLSDEIIRSPIEHAGLHEVFLGLEANDILFIDSSHVAKTGSDVVYLFLNVLPSLRSGVLVHVHDIFLPYEYPREWVIDEHYGFSEQYILQALLESNASFSVLWPGFYLQRSVADFFDYFPWFEVGRAQSFWMKKT